MKGITDNPLYQIAAIIAAVIAGLKWMSKHNHWKTLSEGWSRFVSVCRTLIRLFYAEEFAQHKYDRLLLEDLKDQIVGLTDEINTLKNKVVKIDTVNQIIRDSVRKMFDELAKLELDLETESITVDDYVAKRKAVYQKYTVIDELIKDNEEGN